MEKDPTYYHLNVVSEENPQYVCKFCKKCTIDEINLGPMYTYEDVCVHYFCCLFASGLIQNGNTEKEGILGFLPKDINKEALRGRQFKCTYCNISGATVGCCNKRCQKVFHFNCGILIEVNYQFKDTYNTYCVNHKPNKKYIPFESNKICLICMDNIEIDDTLVKASCCPNGIYHKICIQKMALSAGYFFFKCPACNSTKDFINEMRMLGIYVPERDASWEVEPNAFEELYFTYNKCDSDKCFCAEGREFVEDEGNWSYARCEMCGAAGCHKYCGKLFSVDNWTCESCKAAIVTVNTNKENSKHYNATSSSSSSSGSDSDTESDTDTETDEKVKEKSPIKKIRPKPKELDISKLRIRRKAFNYFPYSREQLRVIKENDEFTKRRCLMDWRKFELRVELTDWIKGSTFIRQSQSQSLLDNEMPCSSNNIPSCSSSTISSSNNSPEYIKSVYDDSSDSDSSSSSSTRISSSNPSSSSDSFSSENNDILVTSNSSSSDSFSSENNDILVILSESECSIVSNENSEKEPEKEIKEDFDNLILSDTESTETTFSSNEVLSVLNNIEDKIEISEVKMNNEIPFKEEVKVVEQTEEMEEDLIVENMLTISQEYDKIIITSPKKKRKINPDDDDENELQLHKIPRLSGDSSKSNSSSSSKENNFLLSPSPSPSKSKRKADLLNNSLINLNTHAHLEFTLENNKIEMDIADIKNDENSNNSSNMGIMCTDSNKAQLITNIDLDNMDNTTISNLC